MAVGTRITVRALIIARGGSVASDHSFVVSILPQPLRHSRARLPDHPQEDDDKAGRRHRQVSGERD